MNIKALIVAGVMTAVFAAPFAAQADSASATASATVRKALTITKQTDLSFGTFSAATTAGTVTIDTTGARTSSNVELLGGTTSAASFTVSGDNNAAYSVSYPTSVDLTAQGASGGADMTATFDDNLTGSPSLDGSGAATINIGAELDVGANQAADTYQASFSVTVAYN